MAARFPSARSWTPFLVAINLQKFVLEVLSEKKTDCFITASINQRKHMRCLVEVNLREIVIGCTRCLLRSQIRTSAEVWIMSKGLRGWKLDFQQRVPLTNCLTARREETRNTERHVILPYAFWIKKKQSQSLGVFVGCNPAEMDGTAHVIDIGWTSVCLSVCPSHAGIVSKWLKLNLSSNCLHCLVAPWF